MRLIIVINSATASKDIRDAVTSFLESKGWEIWHWFEDLWLSANAPNDLDLEKLRDEIRSIPLLVARNTHVMVFGTNDKLRRAGWVPIPSIDWLMKHW
jgi:hypothetical protein